MKIELQGERKSSRFSFFVGVLTGVCDTPSCFLSLALLTAVAGLVMHGWPRYAFAAGEDVPELPDARVGGGGAEVTRSRCVPGALFHICRQRRGLNGVPPTCCTPVVVPLPFIVPPSATAWNAGNVEAPCCG